MSMWGAARRAKPQSREGEQHPRPPIGLIGIAAAPQACHVSGYPPKANFPLSAHSAVGGHEPPACLFYFAASRLGAKRPNILQTPAP
jgi:hypothetical protein